MQTVLMTGMTGFLGVAVINPFFWPVKHAIAAAIDAQRERSLAMCGTMQIRAWEYLRGYFGATAGLR